jgi:hypothetical protein
VSTLLTSNPKNPADCILLSLKDWRLQTARLSPLAEADIDPQDHASYAQIISWFMDDPSAMCPFSVHRMALIGKQLGKEIGEWFGPSTAAGAIK